MSTLCMNTFRNVYNSDLMRYKGHPGGYVRVFLLRKAQYSSSLSKKYGTDCFACTVKEEE